eukprot:GHUV01049398.1.p1 GENE.GHUV01049398.1~~GHUV01049398.1.p1  ORF type:complete len:186 (-),score=61.59 GHUV01049398.1:21-578(-)
MQVARAASELETTVNTYKQHQDVQQQLESARVYLKSDEAASDPDMAGEGRLCSYVVESVCSRCSGCCAGSSPVTGPPNRLWSGIGYNGYTACLLMLRRQVCSRQLAAGLRSLPDCTTGQQPQQVGSPRMLLWLQTTVRIAVLIAEFTREEISELEGQTAELENQLKLLLLPKDPLDERDVMLEIR